MPRRSDRIAHIVETIEKCNQIKRVLRITNSIRHLKPDVPYAGSSGSFTSRPNGIGVIVVSDEIRSWIRFCHKDRTCPMTAADIGHLCTGLELFNDTVERRKP